MRLIDVDALIHDLYCDVPINAFGSCARIARMINYLKKRPTIDAAPVVRCRECKWGKKTSKEGIFYHCGYPYEQTGKVHLPNWYCPGGAQKEDKA